MRDKVSILRVDKLHPKLRDEVKALIDKAETLFPLNIAVRVAQGLRTIEEQNALYALGRTKPGKIVTKARGGKSYHNYGLAIDFCMLHDKNGDGKYDVLSWDVLEDFDKDGDADWHEVVDVFELAGYTWGGRWSTLVDMPHLQKTFGYHWSDLLEKHNKGEFIPGTTYVQI